MQIARLSVPRLRRVSLLLSVTTSLVAAPNPLLPDSRDWSVTVWESSDGLPNNYLTGIAQTDDGYLWVGTYTSLVRFDGTAFDPRRGDDLIKPAIDEIAALASARDGGLWVGGVHGAVLHAGAGRAQVPISGLPDEPVTALAELPSGAVWLAWRGGIAGRLDGTQFVPLKDADPDARSAHRPHHGGSFALDTAGRLWFAEDGRVGTIRDDTYATVFRLRPSATRIAAARGGGIWVTNANKLFRSEDGHLIRECGTLPTAREVNEPTPLAETDDGLWIGTAHDGLIRFDGTRFETVPTSDTNITALFADRQGNLWVGTRNAGLDRVRRRIVELQKPTGKSIRSVAQDADGLIWAATDDGQLLCSNGDRWSTAAAFGVTGIGRASCVAAGRDGALWIGTGNGALRRWQHGTLKTWDRADGLAGRAIHTLVVANSGDIWIGEETPDVVQRLHDGKIESVPTPTGLRFIRAMTEDAAGNVWAGTSRGVLLRLTAQGVVDETARLNPSLRSIRCLYATDDGSVWLGYADKGLGWLKDNHLWRIAAPDTNVSQIVADRRGGLWLAGDRGIFRAQQADLEAYAQGRLDRVHVVHFGESEALASVEANWGAAPGAVRSADGRLWIAMRTGLAVVHPDRIREDAAPPPVFIDRLAVDDRIAAVYGGGTAVARGGTTPLRLAAGHHRLEFAFTALSFDAPENVRFRYRLDGWDDEWIDSGSERRAVYSRLAAGRYSFQVQACNSSGVWNRAGASLAFEVAPFFWQTWWFKVVALGGSIVLAATIVRFVLLRRIHEKLRRLREQSVLDQERARIARDLHDDFGTRLTELGLLAELGGTEAAPPSREAPHELIEHIRSMERDLDAIVWAVNPKNDSLDHLVGFICRTTTELFARSSTRVRLQVPEEVPPWPLSPELRHHLFLVVREAVTNVVKHAHASVATLTLAVAEGVFRFRLEDDGAGFVVTDATHGDRNGLKNMSARIAEMRGQISIRSAPGSGTTVEGWIPLAPDAVLPTSPPAPAIAFSRT